MRTILWGLCWTVTVSAAGGDGGWAARRGSEVLAAARTPARTWLDSLTPQTVTDFGFRSTAEAAGARLLPPIPLYTPPRDRRPERKSVETLVEEPASLWLVPIAAGERIAALVTVDAPPGGPAEAVELGKSFAANRLEAGLRHLGPDPEVDPDRLRFVTFRNPAVDLLLARTQDDHWRWIRLDGTAIGEAHELDDAAIRDLLDEIERTPSDEPFPLP